MLSLPRYLLGVVEILVLLGFAGLGAVALRRRLADELTGAAAALGTLVVAAALLILTAELLGSFGALRAVPYLGALVVIGAGSWAILGSRSGPRRPQGALGAPSLTQRRSASGGRAPQIPTLIALLIAAIAVLHFGAGVRLRLGTGMTGFDSTWYHGPFAAGFFQSANTWNLHLIAPQFLAWFYPANSEIFHTIGMLTFSRDILSPLLNLGWFIACLLACWCIGRPFAVAPFSLALGAVALSLPALADQAGEARSDIVAIFFLLAAVAIGLNAWSARAQGERRLTGGDLLLVGLAAGLAAGTKLNFLLPCAVIVLGLAILAPRGERGRALILSGLGALAGGGYWYLRNLVQSGNPLPWFDHLGPLSLPAPVQALGGREAHDVLSYLSDGAIWSGWFIPGLHSGFGFLWPAILAAALAGLGLCLGPRAGAPLRLSALSGLAVVLAWFVAPTSASGPQGMPHGFQSGLRYLAPALVLGLALLPSAPLLRTRLGGLSRARTGTAEREGAGPGRPLPPSGRRWVALIIASLLALIAIGFPIQRHYLNDRYADPSFATPGLDAAFRWANSISGAAIATTSTRQYPLFGRDLSNRVQFVGSARPHGGFVAAANCRSWRRLLDQGDYDYVVASRDRIEAGKAPYPPAARWTEGASATVVLRKPPTVVFRLHGPLPVAGCPGGHR